MTRRFPSPAVVISLIMMAMSCDTSPSDTSSNSTAVFLAPPSTETTSFTDAGNDGHRIDCTRGNDVSFYSIDPDAYATTGRTFFTYMTLPLSDDLGVHTIPDQVIGSFQRESGQEQQAATGSIDIAVLDRGVSKIILATYQMTALNGETAAGTFDCKQGPFESDYEGPSGVGDGASDDDDTFD
jgi:hypothetical protein